MTSHAKLSPSAAHRWMHCAGSMILEKDIPDATSEHADLGTAAHFLASESLEQGKNATDFLNQQIQLTNGVASWASQTESTGQSFFTVDLEMSENVQKYLDAVRSQANGNQLLVEQRVEFSNYINSENAFGTSDAVVLTDTEIQIHDLKYGRGVKVSAENNEQLKLYALGALNEFGLLGDFQQVRMVIHQPRLGYMSEDVCTIEELEAFAQEAKSSAEYIRCLEVGLGEGDMGAIADFESSFNPGEKQCQWCKAKATCEALAKHNLQTILGEFDDLTQVDLQAELPQATAQVANHENDKLGKLYAAIPLLESWIKAIDSAVHQKLHAGETVEGFKLVQGKQGNRTWANAEEAEALLKSMRLKTEEMYDLKLISPTTAEKLKKAEVIGPRQWTKVEALITRADGKPTVAPENDKRPALDVNPQNDFDDLTA
ncbi:DUF2800 domain-containing protein [Acinetobacter haemolyticus]|uniref:DUF2800 domain-containing protein n=1 Tax=Acinetobacter haemolyticus TaxID=29430 RepID=UPI001331C633|nr:DUF2800 domain-containing protein [Acinetobacter haemolyticus]QHI17212.1 DUF2800 domain-containing protein [Acinetobacter haemolyticus]